MSGKSCARFSRVQYPPRATGFAGWAASRASRATSARGTTLANARRRAREVKRPEMSETVSHQTVGDSRRQVVDSVVSSSLCLLRERGSSRAACHRRSGSGRRRRRPGGHADRRRRRRRARLFEPPFESASSSRRFCSAPGLGRAASSMTTVNASASASPSTSTRTASPSSRCRRRAPGARDHSRYMAHRTRRRLWFGSRCAVSERRAGGVQVHVLDDEVPAAQQQRRLAGNLHAPLVLRRDHLVMRRHRDHARVGLRDDAVRVHDERVEADARAAHCLGRELLEGALLGLGGFLRGRGRGRGHHRVHRALQGDGGVLRRRGRDRTRTIGGGADGRHGGGLEMRATPEPSHGHQVPGGRGEGFGGRTRAPRRRRRDPRAQNARRRRGRRQWWTRRWTMTPDGFCAS